MKVTKMKSVIRPKATDFLLILSLFETSRFSQRMLDGSGAASIITYSPRSSNDTLSGFLSPSIYLVKSSLADLSKAS